MLLQQIATYDRSAVLYYGLRREGATPRSTLDMLIALTAIENKLALLHDDRDFDLMTQCLPELKILNSL